MHLPDAYFTQLDGFPDAESLAAAADRVFAQVFRRDFTAPGFALVSLGREAGSADLRCFMVALKEALNDRYRALTGRRLGYALMGRYNQQTTTRFHIDGSPDEAYLMLGYEPTAVISELSAADFTRAAHDWGVTPKLLLTERNPMYRDHERQIAPYATRLEAFDPAASQVVLLNNSSLAYDGTTFLGVMHKAVIPEPRPEQDRVINSTLIVTLSDSEPEAISAEAQRTFRESMPVDGAAA
jgi:hypothetical protein